MNDPSLIERLKRARAAQVAVVYLGASWFALQLVDTVQDMLSLPQWIGPVTILLLVVGLVVVVATAWVQSLASTTAAEEAGDVPTDWQIAPSDAIASLKAGRLPHLTWGRAALGGVVSLSLAIGAAGGYVLLTKGTPALGPEPIGAASVAAGVAVLPFTVNGPGLDAFAEGMVSLVSTNIDGVDGLRSVNPRTVLSGWSEAFGESDVVSLDDALRAAGATGARYAVLGDAVSTGGTVRLSAELYDLADGSSVGEGGAEGDLDAILSLIDAMSVDLLRTLVAESGTQGATGIQRLDGLVTSSIEALNAYLEGEAHFREGRTTEALEAYERAVAADSLFALGWSRIASALGWIDPGSAGLADARERSLTLADRLPAREAALVRGYADVSRFTATPGVLDDLKLHVRRFPDDPEGWAVLGEYYLHVSAVVHTEDDVAEAITRAVDLDPGFAPYYIHLLRYQVGVGDWRFYEYMESYRGLVSEERAERYQMQWDFHHGDAEARSAAEDFYRDRPVSARNLAFEVFLASDSIGERNLDLIRPLLADNPFMGAMEIQVLASLGRFDEVLPPAGRFTFITPALGSMDQFPRAGMAILTGSTVDGVTPGEGATLLAASLGETIEAVEATETIEAAGLGPGLDVDGMVDELTAFRAAVEALAGGEPERAAAILGALPTKGRLTAFIWPWWRPFYAESLASSGDVRGAIRLYETNLFYWRAVNRLRLGELYEEEGDLERSHENYRGFVRLFSDADEGGQELLERGRAGLARVGG
jgi:tetratricopeptide (TPR) repeat protein